MSSQTRREFSKLTLFALPAVGLLKSMPSLRGAESAAAATPVPSARKPDSKVNGVQIGMNVPYNYGNLATTGPEMLARTLEVGVSAMELRSGPVETFMGAPGGGGRGGRGGRGAAGAAPAATAAPSELAKWRAGASMDKAREFRRIYEDAGVFIEIMKFDNIPAFTDDELDYAFTLARACGARAISLEMPGNEVTKRVGAMADRHRMQVGYHNHAAPENLPEWLAAFEQSKYNGANVDIGHFVAGGVGGTAFKSPLDFIKKYNDRVTHVHIKDRKINGGPNTPFGQGDTPIVEVLRAIRDNKWLIQATIEFEYTVPEGSDRMTEIAKSVQYCRNILAS